MWKVVIWSLLLVGALCQSLTSVSLPFVDVLRSHPPDLVPNLELTLKFARTIPTSCYFPNGVTRSATGPYTASSAVYPVVLVLSSALLKFPGLVESLVSDATAVDGQGQLHVVCEVFLSDPVDDMDYSRDILTVVNELTFENRTAESPLFGMVRGGDSLFESTHAQTHTLRSSNRPFP